MKIIGIDPGANGGVAVIEDGEPRHASIMPKGDGPLTIDVRKLHGLLMQHAPCDAIAIEQVHAFPGQGVVSMFTFGTAFGATVATSLLTGMAVELVAPQAWKKALGLIGADKQAAADWCARRWPTSIDLLHPSARSRVPHSGIADALCIGYYFWTVLEERHGESGRHSHRHDKAARRAGTRGTRRSAQSGQGL